MWDVNPWATLPPPYSEIALQLVFLSEIQNDEYSGLAMSNIGIRANGIAMEAAMREVAAYSNQSVEIMQQHNLAMECRDCEDFLQLGIEAFNWIQRSWQNYQQRIFDGQASHDPQVEKRFTELYRHWLETGDKVGQWIRIQTGRGYYPDNLDEFKKYCEEVRDILEQRSLLEKGKKARANCPNEDIW
ncbi:MAG: hypothetical protein ACWGMZ_01420 [Thermoguttaceae bacterium]